MKNLGDSNMGRTLFISTETSTRKRKKQVSREQSVAGAYG
jgi:hypothetical protein